MGVEWFDCAGCKRQTPVAERSKDTYNFCKHCIAEFKENMEEHERRERNARKPWDAPPNYTGYYP